MTPSSDVASSVATRAGARVALVTCSALPDLDDDDRLLADALTARGVRVEPAVWDAPVDWAAYDLAVLRSTWDYPPRRDEFVAWARSVPRLANPAEVVVWNTDKRYLAALAGAGVPVVPTQWIAAGDAWEPPADGEIVIKPAVGAGSVDSGRYAPRDRELATAQVARLLSAGRVVMVQPYLAAIDTHGETALLFLAGRFSHAVRKGPLLTGPDFGVDGLFREEEIAPREPSAAELAVAEQAIAALPFQDLLYARVDVVPGPDGAPVVIEVELTEPSLFFATAAGAADRLADEILLRLRNVPIRQV